MIEFENDEENVELEDNTPEDHQVDQDDEESESNRSESQSILTLSASNAGSSCALPSQPTVITSRKRGPERKLDDLGKTLTDYINLKKKIAASGDKATDVTKSGEDVFLESCMIRMRKLPEHIKSILLLQISQLFYNAENPKLPHRQITPLPYESGRPQQVVPVSIDTSSTQYYHSPPTNTQLSGDMIADCMRIVNL
ncbi:uncharacterized protein LOC121386666 [Gigantopelta aegis]|uniref:uncharacterized protein LOC121386666 n=1 Tax=Gigantopelta aegis TaxID=1735272 RepID=UPI001B888A0D|nr:uncharacterized protein LOC121386666 [Gigantopelta aegis]